MANEIGYELRTSKSIGRLESLTLPPRALLTTDPSLVEENVNEASCTNIHWLQIHADLLARQTQVHRVALCILIRRWQARPSTQQEIVTYVSRVRLPNIPYIELAFGGYVIQPTFGLLVFAEQ